MIAGMIALLAGGWYYFSAGTTTEPDPRVLMDFVSDYPQSEIGPRESFKITFAQPVPAAAQATNDFLSFSPSAEVNAQWLDDKTLQYTPLSSWQMGTTYQLGLSLNSLFDDVPAQFATVPLTLRIKPQLIKVDVNPLEKTGQSSMRQLSGTLTTSEAADSVLVNQVLKATLGEQPLKVTWQHDADGLRHRFRTMVTVNSRKGKVVLAIDGKPIQSSEEELIDVELPTLRDAQAGQTALKVVVEPRPEPLPVVEEKTVEQPVARNEEEPAPVVQQPVVVQPHKDSVVTRPAVEVKKPTGKPFRFRLLNNNGHEVAGMVELQESTKDKQYQAFTANHLVYVPAPRNGQGVYVVSVSAPGYKPVRVNINYNDPEISASGKGPDEEFIIPFDLKPAAAGDYVEFNHVGFLRTASILTPESKTELDGFIALMKENPKTRIVIHAHCNGTEPRSVTVLGTSKNYFAPDHGNEKRLNVSAKDFTLFRANTVKYYFVSQGIEEDRIKTVGDGGDAMLYAPTSTVANRNDRIEIELKKR